MIVRESVVLNRTCVDNDDVSTTCLVSSSVKCISLSCDSVV